MRSLPPRLIWLRVLTVTAMWVAYIWAHLVGIVLWGLIFLLLLTIVRNTDHLLTQMFWLGIGVWVWRGCAIRMPRPTLGLADRALEQQGHIQHRPIETLTDHLVTGHSRLWARAQTQARIAAQKLIWPAKAGITRPVMIATMGVGVLLIAAYIWPLPLSWAPLRATIWPYSVRSATATPPPPDMISLIPPAYTRLPVEVFPRAEAKATIRVVPGSVLKIESVAQTWPHLIWVGWSPYRVTSERSIPLSDNMIPQAGHLVQQRGLSRTPLAKIVRHIDTPPQAGWNAAPRPVSSGRLELPLAVQDDFGIVSARLTLSPDPRAGTNRPALPNTEYLDLPLPLPGGAAPGNHTPKIDLTDSLWAGRPVLLGLTLLDGAGQSVTLPDQSIILPERAFQNTTAKILFHTRKGLITQGDKARGEVHQILDQVLRDPTRFRRDETAVLALRVATAATKNAQTLQDWRNIAQILWRVAMRFEQGGENLQDALKRLEQAQQKLSDLLNAPEPDAMAIDAAMMELQSAMAEAMQALMAKLQKTPLDPRLQQMMRDVPADKQTEMDAGALQDFMNQLAAEMKAGNRDKARAMLESLQKLTEQMGNPMTTPPPEMMGLMDLIDDIQAIIATQKELRERTENATPDQLPVLTADQVKLQQDLQAAIDKVKRFVPDLPPGFDTARTEMQAAITALQNRDGAGAIAAQTRAIDALQQGQGQAAQQLQQMMQGMTMMVMPGGQPGGLMPNGQTGDGDGENGLGAESFEVQGNDRARIRDILQKLRGAAGSNAPREERDYFERLLRQY